MTHRHRRKRCGVSQAWLTSLFCTFSWKMIESLPIVKLSTMKSKELRATSCFKDYYRREVTCANLSCLKTQMKTTILSRSTEISSPLRPYFPFLLFSSRQAEYCLKKEQKVLRDYFALGRDIAGAGSIGWSTPICRRDAQPELQHLNLRSSTTNFFRNPPNDPRQTKGKKRIKKKYR